MNWRLERDAEELVWLHLDQPDSGANVLSASVLAELKAIVDDLEKTPPRGLILLSDKSNGFIAGADIHELGALETPEMARELITRGDGVFNRLEALPCTTVAVIHGFCLGGGLELALACRYRVAEGDARTVIGLPEIRLGLHPGLGGTVRLPRLIGDLPALRLMLTGKVLSARKALRLGIVDRVVPRRSLRRAARDLALRAPTPRSAKLWQSIPRPLRRSLVGRIQRQTAGKANPEHYPAPDALIDLWARQPADTTEALAAEAQSMGALLFTATARNLMRLFTLEEKLKAYGKGRSSRVRHVHVIGAGTMGAAIAAWCALRGFTVSLNDQRPEVLGKAVREAGALYAYKLDSRRERAHAMDRLVPDLENSGVAHADLVIEAIVEHASAKQALLAGIEDRLKPGAILATNTSAIPIETLGEPLRAPSRLAGLHFFNPVGRVRLVEVVSGKQTAVEVQRRLEAFTLEIGRLPLPVKSSPGFLVNRCLLPYLMEAVLLESEGVPPGVIDRAALDFGMPMGPLALADLVGLEVCLDVARELSATGVPGRLESLVATGKLGVKSGEGFYRYRDGRPLTGHATSTMAARNLTDRLVLRMINEAMAVLREGVVDEPDAVDAGLVFGAGVAPHLGGPLQYARSRGAAAVYARLQEFVHLYGERFAPDPGWTVSL